MTEVGDHLSPSSWTEICSRIESNMAVRAVDQSDGLAYTSERQTLLADGRNSLA